MLRAGITTVGEFHYVHHHRNRFDLDMAVVEAALETGIRLVLIQTLYMRAGFDGEALSERQRRFDSRDVHEFIGSVEELLKKTEAFRPQVTVAVAGN